MHTQSWRSGLALGEGTSVSSSRVGVEQQHILGNGGNLLLHDSGDIYAFTTVHQGADSNWPNPVDLWSRWTVQPREEHEHVQWAHMPRPLIHARWVGRRQVFRVLGSRTDVPRVL